MLLMFLSETNNEIVWLGNDINALLRCKLPWWPIQPKCAQVQMSSIMQHILMLLHFNAYIHAQTRTSECNFLDLFPDYSKTPNPLIFQFSSVSMSQLFQCFKNFKKKFEHVVFMWMIWPILKLPWWPSLEASWTLSNSGKWSWPRYQADSTNLQFPCLL